MIRDAQGKLAITPGKWWYQRDLGSVLSVVGADLFHVTGVNLTRYCRANGNLIAEAGTVTNQTGRTPAELRDLVRELRDAVNIVLRSSILCGWPEEQHRKLDALLKKSEGV